MLTKKQLASVIDHTNLKPDATASDIEKLCQEAKDHCFYSVCVNPSRMLLARKLLNGTDVKLCVVIGFPLGAASSESKVNEASQASSIGADELDMVINIGAVKDGNYDLIKSEIHAVRDVCKGKILKIILETCLLTDEEKKLACIAAKEAGADFVKTSTGFSSGGAVEYDVALLKDASQGLLVKASGGIKTLEDAAAMLAAGADRLGTSSGVAILNDPRLK